jgi:hypothetical protein
VSNLHGPVNWNQPNLAGDVPQVIVNGADVGARLASFDAEVDAQGVVVETAAGQHVPHTLLESPAAPLTLARWEFTLAWKYDTGEEVRARAHRIQALARAGILNVVLDVVGFDFWQGDGARTTFVLSRSTSYGTTGIAFADRPSRCFADGVELTMTTGSPAPGECQSSQTADETSILLGAAPAEGPLVEFRYYPLLLCTVEGYSENMSGRNDWDVEVALREYKNVRSY